VASNLARLRGVVKKIETARTDQQRFVSRYFMDRRTASSTIIGELNQAVVRAGLSLREHSFTFEPIEGTNAFSMMAISGNYEGRYSDLRQFIATIDRSPRFLIIEDITAAPQQEAGKLTARFRINAFVRETIPGLAAANPSHLEVAETRR
jgi:Tfp pilus assembly protein PilO